MSLYLGPTSPTFVNTTAVVTGDLRWNSTHNQYEVFDGTNWVMMGLGEYTTESLADSIEHVVDQIGSYVEEDHKDNVTIQDAYQEWVKATEKFRVIATMAEK